MTDYIEREAALKEFEKVCNVCMAFVNKPMYGDCSVADTVRKVKSIPAADVRPAVRGKWEYISFMTVKCSNCQETFNELGEDNFCPNCGADMREES